MEARTLSLSNESGQWLQPLASGMRGRQQLGSRPCPECLLPDPGEQKSVSLLRGRHRWALSLKEERELGVCFASAQQGGIKFKCQSNQTQRKYPDQAAILSETDLSRQRDSKIQTCSLLSGNWIHEAQKLVGVMALSPRASLTLPY